MNHDIISVAEQIGFTPKDRKAIDTARQQAAEITAIIGKVLADAVNAPYDLPYSWLHCEVDRLEQVLIDQPTHMHAEIFHAAIIRLEEAKLTQNRVSGALGMAAQKVSQSVAAIVAGHLDKCREHIENEANSRRAELATLNDGLFSNADEKKQLEARVAALLKDLQSERTEAEQDALAWLERHGLAMADTIAA